MYVTILVMTTCNTLYNTVFYLYTVTAMICVLFVHSYSYDLTHTLQYNMSPSLDPGSPYFTDCHENTDEKVPCGR